MLNMVQIPRTCSSEIDLKKGTIHFYFLVNLTEYSYSMYGKYG